MLNYNLTTILALILTAMTLQAQNWPQWRGPTANGKVYILGYNGTIWCIDILTGQELWQTKLLVGNGVFYSSPTLAGDKLYICSDEGAFFVCEAQLTSTLLEINGSV